MNKKTLTIFIIGIIGLLITVVIIDSLRSRPDKRGANPYEYNIDEYTKVNDSLIQYRESKNISLGDRIARSMDVHNDEIYLTGENFLMVIYPDGNQKILIPIEGEGECIKAGDKNILIGFKNTISVFDLSGKLITSWKIESERTIITSIAIKGDLVFIADAGNRRVLKYNLQGLSLGEFEGKRDQTDGHGFIVPSPYFDLAVNNDGELWVVNPGQHSMENYTDNGELRGYWTKSSMEIDGFTGCCNPAEITVLEDGSFITSEKGLVRIKVYSSAGKFLCVVAPPEKFKEQGRAPEVAVDRKGLIYALDFDRNTIRVFEKKLEGTE
jgi:hypothetical protein